MILFIHGFNSSGRCQKCLLLQQYTRSVLLPNLDLLDVNETLKQLDQMMQKGVDAVVGASLGGFYAQYVAKKYAKDVVLINPVTKPLELMEAIDLEETDRSRLFKEISAMVDYNSINEFTKSVELLVGLDDDVIDPKTHALFFGSHACRYYADDHRLLKGFGDYLKQSDTLLAKYV